MDFHFGGDVRGRDGADLGTLRAAVLDPGTDQIVSLVIQHGILDTRRVVAPIGSVTGADGSVVDLEFDQHQFSGLPDYADSRNIAPPPSADNLEQRGNIPPENVPDVPPVGAATGVESIAFTPVIEEDINVPPQDQVISGETVVQASDGEVGNLSDVVVDDQTRRLSAFVVRQGVFFTHDVTIPRDWAVSITPDTITLGVDRAQIHDRGE